MGNEKSAARLSSLRQIVEKPGKRSSSLIFTESLAVFNNIFLESLTSLGNLYFCRLFEINFDDSVSLMIGCLCLCSFSATYDGYALLAILLGLIY